MLIYLAEVLLFLSFSSNSYGKLLSCAPPQPIENGQLVKDSDLENFDVGRVIYHECNQGYFLNGIKEVVCTEAAEWTSFPTCEPVKSCYEWLIKGYTTSGPYFIIPYDDKVVRLYCDQETDGGGWDVIQKRVDGYLWFYRNWDSYVKGFGGSEDEYCESVDCEYWLGLENIHRISGQLEGYVLRIDLTDFNNDERYAEYSDFWIGPAADNYRLHIGTYSGNAGNSLIRHSNQMFSTFDEDNDSTSGNCAISYRGSWWYNNCLDSNLNGLYAFGQVTPHFGMAWGGFRGTAYSLKTTEMKIRPIGR